MSVFLSDFLPAILALCLVDVVDDEEVLWVVLLQVHVIDLLVVWILVEDHISPVVLISEDILVRINKHFDLVANFDF